MLLRAWIVAGIGAVLAQAAPVQDTAPTKVAAPTATGTFDFEDATVGEAPKGFTIASTLGEPDAKATPAKWEIAEETKAPSGKRVLKLADTSNRGQVYNLLLRDEKSPADVALEVRLRADFGGEDRGGGLLWRAKDDSNYYVARWNPLEKNLRCYRVEGGKRVMLQSVDVAGDGDTWHTLGVTMKGRVMEISFDGKKQISCADSSYVEAGKVGLWTKADACTSFDDLKIAAP